MTKCQNSCSYLFRNPQNAVILLYFLLIHPGVIRKYAFFELYVAALIFCCKFYKNDRNLVRPYKREVIHVVELRLNLNASFFPHFSHKKLFYCILKIKHVAVSARGGWENNNSPPHTY